MAQKKLQKGSAWEQYDLDADGTVTDGEMAMAQKMELLEHSRAMHENLDRMMDSQRRICWVSSISSVALILVTLLPFISDYRVSIMTSLLSTYVIANLGIVSVFMGSTAYSKGKNGNGASK